MNKKIKRKVISSFFFFSKYTKKINGVRKAIPYFYCKKIKEDVVERQICSYGAGTVSFILCSVIGGILHHSFYFYTESAYWSCRDTKVLTNSLITQYGVIHCLVKYLFCLRRLCKKFGYLGTNNIIIRRYDWRYHIETNWDLE